MAEYDEYMEKAYYRCRGPADFSGEELEEYLVSIGVLAEEWEELSKDFTPLQKELAASCFNSLHMHEDLISRYYFESGWWAAKEDNKLDRY